MRRKAPFALFIPPCMAPWVIAEPVPSADRRGCARAADHNRSPMRKRQGHEHPLSPLAPLV